MKSITDLHDILRKRKEIIGLVEYGSASVDDPVIYGDYDLLVIFNNEIPNIESLHFYVGEIPVDLNIRSLDYLSSAECPTIFDSTFIYGRIVYDPTKQVSVSLSRWRSKHNESNFVYEMTEHSRAVCRHGHKHALDKVKRRVNNDPLLCNLLLSSNMFWLLKSYFKTRRKVYPGEKAALTFIRSNEKELHSLIKRFYESLELADRLILVEKMTDLVLDPIGGSLNEKEVLTFGNEKAVGLKKRGEDLYHELFG